MSGIKQVIVLRKDLNMRKGKMVAQGAHASMGVILKEMKYHYPNAMELMDDGKCERTLSYSPGTALQEWIEGSFTKICVSCNSEEELIVLEKRASDAGLRFCLIEDSGKTEFNGVKTYTALAIGPNLSEDIDKITGDLELL